MKIFGHPVLMYGPETGGGGGTGDNGGGGANAGAGGGNGATGDQGGGNANAGGGAAVALPWAKPDEAWKIGDKTWYDHLPDGPSKDLMRAKAYANPSQLVDAYFSANKMISQNGQDIIVPKDDAPPEAWDAHYAKLGRPANAEAYPDFKMPEGVNADPNMVKFGKGLAFKLGLNPKQAQTLADNWNEFATQQNGAAATATKAQNDTAVAELQTKYGDKWDAGVAAGKRAVAALKADDILDKLEAHIGAAPVLDLFMRLGSQSGEGGVIGSGQGGDPNNVASMTPAQAAARIATLQQDTAFQARYGNAQAEGHREAVAMMESLYMKAGNLVSGG